MTLTGEIPATAPAESATFSLDQTGAGEQVLRFAGSWTISQSPPTFESLGVSLGPQSGIKRISLDGGKLTAWDSTFLTFVLKLVQLGQEASIEIDYSGLPQGAQQMIHLATAVPERQGARREAVREPFLTLVGKETIQTFRDMGETLRFLGESMIAFGAFFRGRARFRGRDLALIVQECGAAALPIVSLIAILMGLILAFVGAVQLRQFGAQIFVADLVGIAMAREMAAIMTAIIMAGRTGAAFAAQLGTMQVNEEVDAFTTLGFSPMEFLVLPRMLALIIMMPLLTIYANLLGMIGGAIVGILMLDISPTEYYNQTLQGVTLTDFALGIFKSIVFGVIIAIAGCMRGIACGRSASAVGLATTSAVVTAIVMIIVTDGIFAVITDILGI